MKAEKMTPKVAKFKDLDNSKRNDKRNKPTRGRKIEE